MARALLRGATLLLAPILWGCGDSLDGAGLSTAESCMTCHNGSQHNDYGGPGLENPHPFPGVEALKCTTCHGGNGGGADAMQSHVPPPPEIGDRANQKKNRHAFFNRLTLTGIDKFPDYTVDGTTYTAIDYLQFVNPSDLRVVTKKRGCGQCHEDHGESVSKSLLATEAGILSGATFAIGVDNSNPAHQGVYDETAADHAFRAVDDPSQSIDANNVGVLGKLTEFPVHSRFKVEGPDEIFKNPLYDATKLLNDVDTDGSAKTGSRLAHLFQEQVAFTCGDCHLGSAGANNRYADFRPSGCAACHMPYSMDGRSRSRDPNVPKDEPRDPDDIDPGERAHVRSHRIVSVKKTLSNGHQLEGIDDKTCAGCHQGSNRTVMQYWGIRLDQNQDVRRRVQYPANPVSFKTTAKDTRLFDPNVGNRTFNGRNANQYLLFEDYDGDGRDDTPADVHHDAGMGCIDCHGSYDLHGGDVASGGKIMSRMEQGVAITCESCHGGVSSYASTKSGTTYAGASAELAVDSKGNSLRHVTKESDGNYYLTSRVTGKKHFIPQTRDVVVDTGRKNPFTDEPLYSLKASYAMGRADGKPETGIGPKQTSGCNGFAHGDTMSCASCHSAWTNTCMGCHLEGEYNTGNNFSNITGDRIVFRERNADFVYQSPVMFQLGVGPKNRIEQVSPNTKAFFRYRDLQGRESDVFAFSDRHGAGNNPGISFSSLGHNAMMAHSIRGKVTDTNEGPRYCTACHMTNTGLSTFRTEYDAFRTAMATNKFEDLDFELLKTHIGKNPNNQLNSPIWVHMVSGLGSGLFLFDKDGCAVNKLDDNNNRVGCDGKAPKDNFDAARVKFNLDAIVRSDGGATGSSNHSLLKPGQGKNLRDGAARPRMAGPLGKTLIERLADPIKGIILDSWLDADGKPGGDATNFLK